MVGATDFFNVIHFHEPAISFHITIWIVVDDIVGGDVIVDVLYVVRGSL